MKRIVTCGFLALLLAPVLVRAQGVGSSGEIRGTVKDPSGAVLPKVSVTLTDTATGLQRAATTSSTGQYVAPGLPPATYDVTAKSSGFSTEIRKNVIVGIGNTVIVDFALKPSQVSTVVEVTGEPPAVETTRGSQADSVNQQYIADLPIDRRDYLTFTLLMPGVSNSTRLASDQDFRVKQTPQSGLSFYGSNGRGNSVTVDGGEANDDSGGVRLNLAQDSVQEFQINRSNYAADLGGASGASINIVSKSGTNTVHGGVFGFFRNDALDARDRFAFSQALQPGQAFDPLAPDVSGRQVKNSLNRQQFGANIGFPIKKDQTFLFLDFEGLRQDAQNAVPILTNTGIFRPEATAQNDQVGIINGLATLPGNPNVPCLTNPSNPTGPPIFLPSGTCAFALQSILTLNPNPGPNPFVTPGQAALDQFLLNQFETNGGLFPYNSRLYQFTVRLDHRFDANNQVFLRYNFSHDLEESPDVQSLIGFSRGSSVKNYDHVLHGSWFHLFSAKSQNELFAQFDYNNFDVIPNVPAQPGLDIPGFANFGTQIFLPNLSILRRPEVADNFTTIHGSHTIKFGGLFMNRGNHTESHTFFPGRFVFGDLPGGVLSPCLQVPAACGLFTANPATVNSLQSASLGLPLFYEQGFGNPVYNYPRPYTAFYVQDSWQVRPNFTLNYGLRYELDSQYGPLNTDKDNFAPRVSFAWDPFNDHKTVVRAGFGIFYSPIYAQIPDVVYTLGNINGTRPIANILVPLTGDPLNPAITSASIFQGLFAQPSNPIACTTPAPGNAACITPANLAPLGVTISNTGPLPPLTVLFSGQPNYQNPYSEQASIGVEREIGNGFTVSVSGIYTHTLRLPVAIDTNALPAPFSTAVLANGQTVSYRNWNSPACGPGGALCFADPLLLQGDQYSSKGWARYEAAIIEVKKRFSEHFTFMGNYTYSKAYDTTTDFNSDFGPQDNTNLRAEYALSDFDQRHKIVIAGVLSSPFTSAALRGFELSPIISYNSGHPFTLLANSDVNGDRHYTNDRPIGAGRNTGIGPNFVSFDMRLARSFKVSERASLQLLAEGFNITNRSNYATVNNVVGPFFGLPLSVGGAGATTFHVSGNPALSPSQPLGFTSEYAPRQIQLGVRLTF